MRPKIAVIGASRSRAKFGNKCVRAFAAEGWEVYPVNPHAGEIEGLRAYPSLAEVPVALDRVSIYLPPPLSARLIPSLVTQGAGEVWFNPGSANAEVLAEARRQGLEVRAGCSIVDIGRSPAEFP